MSNIHKFSTQDEIETEASEWLVRLDGDDAPTKKQLNSLREWINRSSVHRKQLLRLARHWDNANILTELSDSKHYKSKNGYGFNFWTNVYPNKWWRNWKSATVIATVLLVGIVFGKTIFNNFPQSSIAENGLYETRVGEQNTITLADGSIIELNTNSNIQVDYSENKRSVTLLQGEAHFEVSKDPNRPFEVIAGGGKINAIGTAFAVRLNNQTIKVTVTEGKVSLSAISLAPRQSKNTDLTTITSLNSEGTYVSLPLEKVVYSHTLGFLEAGQSVEFEPSEITNMEEIIEVLEEHNLVQQLAWRKGLLLFEGESLFEVVREINRYTEINIEIDDPAISEIRIGGQFKVGETEALLRVLETNFNIKVHSVDDHTVHLSMKNKL